MSLFIESLRQDFSHGVRILFRERGFSIVALLTLALGIGANTAIFSVVNAVALKPLPYPDSNHLIVLDEYRVQHGSRTVSWMDFRDWREQNRVFDDMAAYRLSQASLSGQNEAALLRTAEISAPFFKLLGTRPLFGRFFTEQDDGPGTPPTVVISYDLWKTRLGGNSDVIGKALALSGASYTVIGIAPAEFGFFEKHVDAYLPVGLHGADAEWVRRGNHPDLLVLAHLRPGISLQSARAEFDVIMRRLEQNFPQSNTGLIATLTDLHQFRYGRAQTVLLALLASVFCILLIACVNVASLLLARSSSRKKEMAIRAAMGADRWRLAQQMLAESIALAFAGGVLGILLAVATLRIVITMSPQALPEVAASPINGTVLLFTLAVSLVSGLLFGCAPAMQIAWGDLNSAFNELGRSGGTTRRGERVRSALLVGEIAIALILLTSAGLVIFSLVNAMKVDPGFEAQHLLALDLTVPPTSYVEWNQKAVLFTQAVDRLKTVPGIRAAGATQCPPLSGVCVDTAFMLADHPVASVIDIPTAASNIVVPGYFEAMQVRLLSGRFFSSSDNQHARLVVIVNQSFATRHWPNQSALGKQIREGGPQGNQPYREIVGVVADVKQSGMDTEARPEVFLPLTQFPFAPWTELPAMTFVVRTDGDPNSVADSAKQELLAIDKDLPVTAVRPMVEYISDSLERRRFSTMLLIAFALLALLLAAVGTYGVMAYNVSQNAHEIGVRMALGATPASIRTLILGKALSLAGAGIAIGWIGGLMSTHWLAGFLFGIRSTDPLTFGCVAAILMVVAALASYLPMQRALAIQPASLVRAN